MQKTRETTKPHTNSQKYTKKILRATTETHKNYLNNNVNL